MSRTALTILRVSIGYLLVIWGVDKLVSPAHGIAVSDRFYLGVFTFPELMPVFGVAELILGGLVILGIWRRYTYPVVVAIAAVTAAGVWRSIVDPWGWYLQGANALFYPSLIILAASLVLLAEEWQDATRAPSMTSHQSGELR